MSAKEQDDKKKDAAKKDAASKDAVKKDAATKDAPAKSQAADAPKEVEKKSEAIDPTQTYMASAWKYARPLTACRYDPSGKYVYRFNTPDTLSIYDSRGISRWAAQISFRYKF